MSKLLSLKWFFAKSIAGLLIILLIVWMAFSNVFAQDGHPQPTGPVCVVTTTQDSGIEVDDVSNSNIGDAGSNEGDLISGNLGNGITLQDDNSSDNVVVGNLIETAADGSSNLGDGGYVVSVINYGIEDNQIGGVGAGEANTSTFNGSAGVYISNYVDKINIRGNAIFSNSGLGIDLHALGVTTKFSGDGDGGRIQARIIPLLRLLQL